MGGNWVKRGSGWKREGEGGGETKARKGRRRETDLGSGHS